jgi:hypothetical protein
LKRFLIGRGTTNQRLDWGGSTTDVIAFVGPGFWFVFFSRRSWEDLLLDVVVKAGATAGGGATGGRIGAAGKTPDRGYVSYFSEDGIIKVGTPGSL